MTYNDIEMHTSILEEKYLKEHKISRLDFLNLLKLIGNSSYLKISSDYKKCEITYDQYVKLIKKFKDANLVKEVKGELRLDPYFYTRLDSKEFLVKMLLNQWDNAEFKPLPDHTDYETGEIFTYSKKTSSRYTPKTIDDFST